MKEKVDRHLTQIRWIMAQRYRYYVLMEPVYSDAEFDAGMRLLERLEQNCPELVHDHSPTQFPEAPPCGWKAWFDMPKWLMRQRFYETS